MLVGVIADDFTGASDIANTLAKGISPEGGLKTAQFSGVPTKPVEADIEAGVISLKSRSSPVEQAIRESLEALHWLLAQGCVQILFKYCSTFDSTKNGNIGPVSQALAKELDTKGVIVCPAFPAAGRTVYKGHLFVFDKLLNESGMQNHPLTPMIDSDIRRWLGHQSAGYIDYVDIQAVRQGHDSVRKTLQLKTNAGADLIVVDAISDQDLLILAEAASEHTLITGGSGIALGLPRNFIKKNKANGNGIHHLAVTGPEAILAGSCSGATRSQILKHALSHPTFEINVDSVMESNTTSQTLVDFIQEHEGKSPLVFSSANPEDVRRLQNLYGKDEVSNRLEKLFAQTACKLVQQGCRRLIVAGGETSGAVARAVSEQLAVTSMRIGPEIDPGVPILILGEKTPVALALKSGNFGSEGFFEKALKLMETPK